MSLGARLGSSREAGRAGRRGDRRRQHARRTIGRFAAAAGLFGGSGRHHPPGVGRVHGRPPSTARMRTMPRCSSSRCGRLAGWWSPRRPSSAACSWPRTPIAVLVGPSGSRAASAGFILVLAADVAVMAPGTHMGAAHPVSSGRRTCRQPDETMSKKVASDLAAWARSLAEASQAQRHAGGRSGPR